MAPIIAFSHYLSQKLLSQTGMNNEYLSDITEFIIQPGLTWNVGGGIAV